MTREEFNYIGLGIVIGMFSLSIVFTILGGCK